MYAYRDYVSILKAVMGQNKFGNSCIVSFQKYLRNPHLPSSFVYEMSVLKKLVLSMAALITGSGQILDIGAWYFAKMYKWFSAQPYFLCHILYRTCIIF